ncbi:MAG: hypothetical protein JSV76_06485, partial [Candidatus Bathyarchaeota archaeon]
MADPESTAYVNGLLIDVSTHLPIENSHIQIGIISIPNDRWIPIENTTSDNAGRFSFTVETGSEYGILIISNSSDTKGFDYIPVFDTIMVNENVTFTIQLYPAMSIVFSGDIYSVESFNPSDYYCYSIITENLPKECILEYGTSPPCNDLLKMPSNHVIVPLQEEFSINLSARIVTQQELTVQNFSISGIETSNFAQGARLDLAVQQYTIPHDLNLTVNNLDAALELHADIESKGFYTITEKQALIQATSLLELAKEKFLANNFRESYADIRESYLNIVNTNTRLNDIVANSVNSVFILIVSINMTAMVLAYLFCKNKKQKYILSIILFVPLFILLYNFYPGFQIIQFTSLFRHMLISLGITFGTTLILPSLAGEKITSIFSLAKANLLNRKLRFILTLLSV